MANNACESEEWVVSKALRNRIYDALSKALEGEIEEAAREGISAREFLGLAIEGMHAKIYMYRRALREIENSPPPNSRAKTLGAWHAKGEGRA